MRGQTFSSLFLPGAFLFLVLFSNVVVVLSTAAVNRSIDDSLGDSVTGQRPIFLPSTAGVWADQTQCSVVAAPCGLLPPITSAFDGTYTAATYNPGLDNMSITFDFTGTAVYIFFILANNPADGITATTAANFTIDGALSGTFSHSPDSSAPDFQFNQSSLAFSKTGMKNATHQMIISTSGLSENVWVNFDYALYTFQEGVAITSSGSHSSTASRSSTSSTPSPSSSSSPEAGAGASSSSSHTGAIAGGVIAGLVAIGALIVAIFFCRRRQRRMHQLSSGDHEASTNNSGIPREINPFMLPAEQRPAPAPIETARTSRPSDAETSQNQSHYAESSVGAMSSNEDHSPQYQSRSVISTLPSGRIVMSAGTSRDYLPATVLSAAYPSSGILDSRAHFLSGTSTSTSTDANPPVPLLAPAPNTKAELRHRRQQELERQMRVINEEIEDLRNEAAERAEGDYYYYYHFFCYFSITDFPSYGNLDVVQMKEQIRAMSEQIAFLQSHQNSAWAQGLSDEPPPGYSPNPVEVNAVH
ncbi:hypothetical protein BT96DRAFT_1017864 [Gymnopus androsaceus JB14]|uniref:Mid2 domain-containing protein n=1 Tax=Gymnopus androsaceus JB14 TaxID=1447944 RepID=A0A6A4HWF0_9AGAR|nr:hypothetical protein BT96DRAFT_1017864 [Gymnopus androsaceus JB14]